MQNKTNGVIHKIHQNDENISLTTDLKTKIPLVKMKNHISKINYQNFSLIKRLMKQDIHFAKMMQTRKKRWH